mgnify:CR=1 FL=1
MDIISYMLPHDAAYPQGYAIHCGNKKFCLATDLGYFSKEVEYVLKDADAILLESNHDVEMLKFGPYPYELKRRILGKKGHLSNDDCGKAILDILNSSKFKRIVLGHLSKINNYPELAYQTVAATLSTAGVKLNVDVNVSTAKRNEPSNFINF